MSSINCSNMDRLKSLSRSKNYRQLPRDAAHPAENNHSSSSTTALVDDVGCNEAESRYFMDKREDVVLRIRDDNTSPDLASARWRFSDDDEEGGVFHRSQASLDPRTELPAASEAMMKDMDMAADGSGVVRSTAGSRQGIWRECSYDLIAGHHHEVELAAAASRKNGRSSNSRFTSSFTRSSNEVEKSRRRGTSFDFGSLQQVDPPSRLIGTFLQRQEESGEHSLDMNLGFDLQSCCPEVQLLAASDHHHSSTDQNRVLDPMTSSTSSDPFPLPISSRTATESPIITTAGSMTDLSRTATPATAASRIPVRPPISSRVTFQSRVDTNTAAPARDSITENSTSGNDDLDYAQQQPMNNIELLQERRELNTSTPVSRSEHESSTPGEPNQEPQEQNLIYSHGLRARRTSTSSTKPASKEAENSISGMSDQEEEAENLKSSPKSFSPRGLSRLASGASTATPFSRVKSRFAEPPKGTTPATSQQQQQRSGQQQQRSSGQIRSTSGQQRSSSGQLRQSGLIPRTGLLSRVTEEEELEEDLDPFRDIDLPEKFKSQHEKWGWVLLVEWLVLVLMVGALVSSIVIPKLKRVELWGLLLWKWVVVALVTICGRLVSGWVIRILVFFLERSFILRKRVLYFVYALRKGVQNLLWLAFVLITWHFLLNPQLKNAIKVLNYITKALVCFLIAAVLVVVKIFLVKVLASCFHVDKYFERIRDSLFNQFVLETLMGPPVEEERQSFIEDERLKTEVAGLKKAGAVAPGLNMDQLTHSFLSTKKPIQKDRPQDTPKSGLLGKSGLIIGVSKHSNSNTEAAAGNGTSSGVDEKGISIQNLAKLNRRNVSAWNMKRLINLVKHTGVATLTHNIEDNLMEADGNVGDQSNREINSEWQAKVAAKQIFENVARPGRKYITERDLLRFMNEEEVSCTLPLFDGAMETGRITPHVLKSWVVNVYRERRALSLSLSDTKTAVNKLHQILNVILFTILIIIWLLVLGIATKNLLVFVSSQLLLVVFIFGNTCKNIFEAIVFLFVLHPFDVGDRCIIDGTQMVVEEMNILSTIFIGDANVKVWYPNSVLATKPIQNFYRSPEMGDNFDFVVDASTPAEKIALLKERIGTYIQSKPHHWKAKFGLLAVDVEEINKLKLSLGLSHTMNYQDYGEKVARKSELLWEMRKIFKELGIAYHLPTKEVYCHTNLPIESKMDTL